LQLGYQLIGNSMLSEPNMLFMFLGVTIVLAAFAGIACLLSNIDHGLALFKCLYGFSMLVSVATFCLFAVEVTLGHLETHANWLTAFGACFSATLSIFYGFFGFVQSHRRPSEVTKTSRDYGQKVH
jgi:hypothetical protein